MRTAAIAIALLMSGAAVAQTYSTTQTTPPDVDVDADVGVQPDGDLDVDADVDVDPATTTTTTTDMRTGATTTTTHGTGTMTTHGTGTMTTQTLAMAPASGPIVQPSNANPEHDARGIAVISDPAVVPAGFNGVTGTALGGPLVDPTTGESIDAADDSYPACSASVTDNCLQTYERGRSSQ